MAQTIKWDGGIRIHITLPRRIKVLLWMLQMPMLVPAKRMELEREAQQWDRGKQTSQMWCTKQHHDIYALPYTKYKQAATNADNLNGMQQPTDTYQRNTSEIERESKLSLLRSLLWRKRIGLVLLRDELMNVRNKPLAYDSTGEFILLFCSAYVVAEIWIPLV